MIAIHGTVVIHQIVSRGRTTTLTDAGAIDAGLSITGQTAKRWHTVAQAKEVERQVHELAWYSRHAGGVHIDSDEFAIDDGLYDLSGVETSMDQVTWGGAVILRVSLTLRRLGGSSTIGPNVARRVSGVGTLATNGFSATLTPTLALPVGGLASDLFQSAFRTGADGSVPVRLASTPWRYQLIGADYNLGECKVWDTLGDATPANWLRVWSPDHTFANVTHCVIDNGLVRFTPHAGFGEYHIVSVWNTSTSGWSVVGANDQTSVAGGTLTRTGIIVDELSPYRVVVTFLYSVSVSPFRCSKTITLERGKRLAMVRLAVATEAGSISLAIGLDTGPRWTALAASTSAITTAADETVTADAGSVSLSTPTENWMATWVAGTNVLGLAAFRATASYGFNKTGAGGLSFGLSAAELVGYLGGMAYDVTKAQGEAEVGTLTGGAAAAPAAGASGGGSNAVTLNVAGATVRFAALANPPTGTRVRVWVRAFVTGTTAGQQLRIQVRNITTTAAHGFIDFEFSALGAATWRWVTTEYTSWNGTDQIAPEAVRLGGTTDSLYVDQALFLTVAGGSDFARDLGLQALTETRSWAETTRLGG